LSSHHPSPRHCRPLAALLALCAVAYVHTASPLSGPVQDLSTYPRVKLEIRSGAVRHTFDVWVADTPARQEQGLMFVRELAANRGMLFPNCCSGIWMKDCYIDLDILFLADQETPAERPRKLPRESTTAAGGGVIAKLAPRAQPHDETTIPAPADVVAVVELKGGSGELFKLKVGDRVTWTPE